MPVTINKYIYINKPNPSMKKFNINASNIIIKRKITLLIYQVLNNISISVVVGLKIYLLFISDSLASASSVLTSASTSSSPSLEPDTCSGVP